MWSAGFHLCKPLSWLYIWKIWQKVSFISAGWNPKSWGLNNSDSQGQTWCPAALEQLGLCLVDIWRIHICAQSISLSLPTCFPTKHGRESMMCETLLCTLSLQTGNIWMCTKGLIAFRCQMSSTLGTCSLFSTSFYKKGSIRPSSCLF